jgi:hypothetical protein
MPIRVSVTVFAAVAVEDLGSGVVVVSAEEAAEVGATGIMPRVCPVGHAPVRQTGPDRNRYIPKSDLVWLRMMN